MDYDSDGHNYIGHDYIGGMDYDSDGLLRAEWPSSGHYEVTPMLWTTMHWTAFIKPGWRALPCADEVKATGRCALKGGGNYAALASADSEDFAIIVHAFTHKTSKCIRNDICSIANLLMSIIPLFTKQERSGRGLASRGLSKCHVRAQGRGGNVCACMAIVHKLGVSGGC